MGLFSPAWMRHNEEKAINVVKKERKNAIALLGLLNNNNYIYHISSINGYIEKLGKIAKSAPLDTVRKVANDTLSEIAEKYSSKAVAVARDAIGRLTDDKAIAILARSASGYYVRSVALERLTDQSQLAYIAKRDVSDHIRMEAAERLSDKVLAQKVFADIALRNAEYTKSYSTYEAAVKRLTDQSVLTTIAIKDTVSNKKTGCLAVEILTDTSALKYIADNARSCFVYKLASEKIGEEPHSLHEKDHA